MLCAGVLVMGSCWGHWFKQSKQEEASHVWLVIPFGAAIMYANRKRFAGMQWGPSWVGPALVVVGLAIAWFGYNYAHQSCYHFGATLIALGAVASVLGHQLLLRFWPAFLILGFMTPLPNSIRLKIAVPLQSATAVVVDNVLQFFGEPVGRQNNSLTVNGQHVLIVEACNGMRMVFTLILVCWLFAFITPLKNWVRFLIIGLSPATALVCNIIRLIPTLVMYGHASKENAETFHDYAGWAMLVVAFFFLMFVIKFIDALGIEVRSEEAQAGPPAGEAPCGESKNPDVLAAGAV